MLIKTRTFTILKFNTKPYNITSSIQNRPWRIGTIGQTKG